MSEITEQEDSEQIFATEEPESDTDTADATTEVEDAEEGEQKAKELELKEPEVEKPKAKESKQPKGKEQKKKQISTWVQAIKDDKKSFEDIPEQWLKDEVKAQLNVSTTHVDKVEIKEEVREAILEERAEQKYKAQVAELNSLGLSKAQQETLQDEFTNFRGLKLSRLESLESAMKIAQVDIEKEYIERKRQGMKLPKATYNKSNAGEVDNEVTWSENMENVSEDKRREYLEKMTS